MGSENLNPLDELKTLDQQVEKVGELAGLKPIFFRLDEIAKQNPNDFEVQLVVGDIKQHLVNRGTRIKEMQQTAPEPPPPPASPPPPPIVTPVAAPPVATPPSAPPPIPPPVTAAPPPPPAIPSAPKTIPSGQFNNPPSPVTSAPLTSAVLPTPPVQSPPLSSTGAAMPPVRKAAPIIPPPPLPVAPQGPLATTEHIPPPAPPAGTGSSLPSAKGPAMQAPPPAQPPPPPRPPGSTPNWKRALAVGALAGSVVSIALIALLVNQARKRNARPVVTTVQVQIATAPSGASVRINGDVQCTSDCTVPLAPGNYQVTAFLDGYEPAASGISVVAGQPNSVNLTLDPQAQAMRILSDLDQGKVVVDDQPPADLQEGQFVLEKVAPGAHMVKVTGKNSDASFGFVIEAGKPPAITSPVAARNLIAVLVSSFGSQGHVVTNSGPMKLVVNGQPEGDAGPAGIDLKNFQAGVDELLVGDGKDQRNMKESFGPAPMLTVFLKSDLNIGTLIVSTGQDDARVFLNDKEYRLRTKRGEVRIQTIGKVAVRVAKDGFQNEPVQTAEVKKGVETRLEFKLRTVPQVSTLQLRGATPGAEVAIDQKTVGTVAADGTFSYNTVAPGDHSIELKRDQFAPKRFQRLFQSGQTVEVRGVEVVLTAIVTNATVKLTHNPADEAISYRRNEETQTRELRGNQVDLPPGTYVFTATAPGYIERSVRFTVAGGETRTIDLTLTRVPQVTAQQVKPGDITDFEDPTAWKQEGDLWVHKGAGFIPFKPKAKGVFTFTVTLVHGGSLFRGGRIRWALQYEDAKNYDLFELDKKNFWGKVVAKGKTADRARTQHNLDKEKSYTIQVEVTPEHVVHKIRTGNDWLMLDTWAEAGRDFTNGKFGFLIQGNDEIGVSDFKFEPK